VILIIRSLLSDIIRSPSLPLDSFGCPTFCLRETWMGQAMDDSYVHTTHYPAHTSTSTPFFVFFLEFLHTYRLSVHCSVFSFSPHLLPNSTFPPLPSFLLMALVHTPPPSIIIPQAITTAVFHTHTHTGLSISPLHIDVGIIRL